MKYILVTGTVCTEGKSKESYEYGLSSPAGATRADPAFVRHAAIGDVAASRAYASIGVGYAYQLQRAFRAEAVPGNPVRVGVRPAALERSPASQAVVARQTAALESRAVWRVTYRSQAARLPLRLDRQVGLTSRARCALWRCN